MASEQEKVDPKNYENYDYYYYDEEVQQETYNDICHEFEYSILFFMVVSVVGICFAIYIMVLVTKRRNCLLYGFDILYSMLFLCAAIRFSVKIWQAVAVHGHGQASQSGCKLIAYTNIGMSHVLSYLVAALVIYSWLGMKSSDFGYLDKAIRQHLGWLVVFTFALEGIFGMAPAIYMDVADDHSSCNATQTMGHTVESYVAAHILLQAIFPYVLPFAIMSYPLYCLITRFRGVADDFYRGIVRNTIIVSVSYMIIYSPMAIMAMVVFPTILSGANIAWGSLCIVEGIFRFLHDSWFIMTVFVVILGDRELGQDFPGKKFVVDAIKKVRGRKNVDIQRHHRQQLSGIEETTVA